MKFLSFCQIGSFVVFYRKIGYWVFCFKDSFYGLDLINIVK